MTTCPLPIDWLDFVEGKRTSEMTAHLEICPSCREVVASLQRAPSPSSDWLQKLGPTEPVVWEEKRPAEARPGQIWLSLSSFHLGNWGYADLNRLFLAVLDVGPEEAGSGWFQVAPLWIDTENADSTDLLLRPVDTTLGGHWRLTLGLQALVNRAQLDACVGELTDSGRKLLSALEGQMPIERMGTEIESENDPRLRANAWLESAVALLNTAHLAEAEGEEQNEDSGEAPTHRTTRLLQMTVSQAPPPRQRLAWAARSAIGSTVAQVRLVHGDVLLEGHFEYDNDEDAVILVVDQARGWEHPFRVYFSRKGHEEDRIQGPRFPPQAGIRVVLTKGMGIVPKQVTDVWAEVEV
jgi:hypothetical protein